MPVKNGDKIKIEYTGTLEDGVIFDSTEKHGKPLEIEMGAGLVIKGFEEALLGMEVGEEKEVTIESEKAYGHYNPALKHQVPREKLPEGDLKPGMMLMVGLQNGQQTPAKIVEINDQTVTIDLNHPLVDKTLKFKLKIVEIN